MVQSVETLQKFKRKIQISDSSKHKTNSKLSYYNVV